MTQSAAEQAAQLEGFYQKWGGTNQGKFRQDRTDHRDGAEISREKIPRKLLPDSSQKILLVRTQEMQHPTDPVFAMQFLGCVSTMEEADEITEEIYHEGYDRHPIRAVDLNQWRVFPPPLNASEGDVKYHQLLLRQIMNRDTEELNRQEAELTARVERAREQETEHKRIRKEFNDENMQRLKDGLEPLDAEVLQSRQKEWKPEPVPDAPVGPAKPISSE
jgi:hypothetical protein